ncbi:MAG: hypothetical protein N3A38_03555, partial [Planctomycetota bacterium]|nr:hypothetical protein [Planctomycetota bacterium]
MNTMHGLTTIGFLGLALCVAASGGETSFSAKPTAIRDGDGARIRFAVSAPTDVAVYIEDAGGRVVRHLVAGVLGQNPPPPLKPGLVQELIWDGKADYGKPAGGGPFQVRVALGFGAKCDRIFSRPEKFSGQCTLAVGPDGALYVRENACQVTNFPKRRLVVLNRDGSYRRTLLPFASTPGGEGGRGVPGVITLGGRPVPGRESEVDLMPWIGGSAVATMAVSADGKVLYFPLCGGNPFRPAEIMQIATNGGGVLGRHPLDRAKIGELPEFAERSHLAVSSDGKSLFIAGLQDRRGKGAPAVIYRLRLPECAGLDVFFGERNVPGRDAARLGAMTGGLASDGKGNLLACDPANNRVLVLGEDDGRVKGEIACDAPSHVGVHRASGAVYVVANGKGGARLVKYAAWKDARPAAELPLPRKGAGADTVNMVVDGAADRAVIWLALSRCGYLARAEDTGSGFEVTDVGGKFESFPGPRQEFGYCGLAVDRATAEVYVMNSGTGHCWERFDESGRSTFIFPQEISNGSASGQGPQLVPGPDGVLYGIWWRHTLAKWDRTGKRLTWDEPRIPTEEELKVYPEKPPAPGPSVKNYARVGMVGMPHTLGVRWSDGHIFVFEPYMITQGDGGRIPKALHEYLPSGRRVTAP